MLYGLKISQSVMLMGWRHPQWWLVGLIVSAWVALILDAGGYLNLQAHHLVCSTSTQRSAASLPSMLLSWALMVVAMMFPLVMGQAKAVALSSAWRRRHLAMAWFMATYLGVWVLLRLGWAMLMAILAPLTSNGLPWEGNSAPALAMAVAVFWYVTPIKRRALARCHRRSVLPMSGWRADVACLVYGTRQGLDCAMVCWPTMLVLLMVPHNLTLMAAIMCLVLFDRYMPH